MLPKKRIQLPLYLVVLLLVALAMNLVRGFDLARRHGAELQPARGDTVLDLRSTDPQIPVLSTDDRFLLVRLERRADARLALHQIFPERDLARWVENEAEESDWLILPLAGLPPGEFAFRWAEAGEHARAVDPDWKQPERKWLGRFRLIED